MVTTVRRVAASKTKKTSTRRSVTTTAAKPTRGTQTRALITRERILSAAIRVFSESGFSGGSLEKVCKLSQTHDRMIYYYFGSKERLYTEALETIYQRMRDAESTLELDINDPVGALTKVIHFTWQYHLDHPEFLRILNSENLCEGKHVRKSVRVSELSLPAVRMLEQILRIGVRQGVFRRDIDPNDLYIVIAGLGYFYLSNRYTLSAFLNTDLMSKKSLAHWPEFITEIIIEYVTGINKKPAKRGRAKIA